MKRDSVVICDIRSNIVKIYKCFIVKSKHDIRPLIFALFPLSFLVS